MNLLDELSNPARPREGSQNANTRNGCGPLPPLTRREALAKGALGMGALAASGFWARQDIAAEPAPPAAGSAESVLRVETDAKLARVPVLSWDTEGGNQTRLNLLRAPAELRVRGEDRTWRTAKDLPTRVERLEAGGAAIRST